MHTMTVPEGCTGTVYAVNPDAPDEGHDIAHEHACPAHPDASLVCPWCHRPTTAGPQTRPLKVGGKVIGELCPDCTAESYTHEADLDPAGYGDHPW